jgi:hypothetical protein
MLLSGSFLNAQGLMIQVSLKPTAMEDYAARELSRYIYSLTRSPFPLWNMYLRREILLPISLK